MKMRRLATRCVATAIGLAISAAAVAAKSTAYDEFITAAGDEGRSVPEQCGNATGLDSVDGWNRDRCRSRAEDSICAAALSFAAGPSAAEAVAPQTLFTRETAACGNYGIPTAIRIA